MTIKEFCEQDYGITSTETINETCTTNLQDFQNNKPLEDCETRVDEYTPTGDPIIYNIYDPDGNQLTSNLAENALTSEKAVRQFIKNLPGKDD